MAKDEKRHVREMPMTYEDYAKLPDDGNRYELVDGRLELMSPSPNRSHQMLVSRLMGMLIQSCGSDYEIIPAPVDVVISETEVRQPDLVAIHLNRMHIYKRQGNIVEPPDLVVEILSLSSLRRDKVDKHDSYAKFGVPEYWLVNPDDESVEKHVLLSEHTYTLMDVYTGHETVQSQTLKCVSYTVDDLMQRVRDLPYS